MQEMEHKYSITSIIGTIISNRQMQESKDNHSLGPVAFKNFALSTYSTFQYTSKSSEGEKKNLIIVAKVVKLIQGEHEI